MTTCLELSCLSGLECAFHQNVYQFVCVSFPFGFVGGMLGVMEISLVLCLSLYFVVYIEKSNVLMLCNSESAWTLKTVKDVFRKLQVHNRSALLLPYLNF